MSNCFAILGWDINMLSSLYYGLGVEGILELPLFRPAAGGRACWASLHTHSSHWCWKETASTFKPWPGLMLLLLWGWRGAWGPQCHCVPDFSGRDTGLKSQASIFKLAPSGLSLSFLLPVSPGHHFQCSWGSLDIRN